MPKAPQSNQRGIETEDSAQLLPERPRPQSNQRGIETRGSWRGSCRARRRPQSNQRGIETLSMHSKI